MAGVDLTRYKRMVQGFFDPEPKNDRAPQSPIWCLGVKYESETRLLSTPSSAESLTASHATNGNKSVSEPSENQQDYHSHKDSSQAWPIEFLDDYESKFWITYRSNFPPIQRSLTSNMTLSVRLRNLTEKDGFTSDTGWGCMIRSGQSLLANTLSILRMGRGWRRQTSLNDEKELISYFADDPAAPFSIHRFVEHGAQACGKHPGEWFGPSATARCIQALTHAYQPAGLQVYVNADGADVYQDQIFRIAKAQRGAFSPVLILLGVRLGIDHVTPAYRDALKDSLRLSQSMGIAGGRPSSSHYFVATQGDDFFYLDPHFTRPALPFHASPSEYLDEEAHSCHTRRLRRVDVSNLDPSMLLAFLIRDEEDWKAWRAKIECFKGKTIIHVADSERLSHGQDHERPSALDDVESFDDEDGG